MIGHGLALLCLLAAPAEAAPAPAPAERTLGGMFHAAAGKSSPLRLTFTPGKVGTDQPWTGTAAHDGKAVALEGRAFEDGLRLWSKDEPPEAFDGEFDSEQRRLTGFWTQGNQTLSFDVGAAPAPVGAPMDASVTLTDRTRIIHPELAAEHEPGYLIGNAHWPVVSGMKGKAAEQRLAAALVPALIFDEPKLKLDDDATLKNIDGVKYEATYNAHGLLSIDFTIATEGAYPEWHTVHRLFDLRTGKPVAAADALRTDRYVALQALLQKQLEKASDVAIAAFTHGRPDEADECMLARGVGARDLATLGVNKKGEVFFTHDWGCSHAMKGNSPKGQVVLTADELKTYARPDGPLAALLKK